MRDVTTRTMSDAHEMFLARLYDGRRTPGSGNQPNNQMDGRNRRYDQAFPFAWDGKSTFNKSIGVSGEMWEKAVLQAGAELPMLALRWYLDRQLHVSRDLVVVDAHDFAEVLAAARRWEDAKECLAVGHESNPVLHPQGVATSCWRCGTEIVEEV